MLIRNTPARRTVFLLLIILFLYGPAAAQSCILMVTSIPDEGVLTIDERQQGMTPLSISLPCGDHSLSIMKPGYEPYHEQVFLHADEHRHIVANLEYRSDRGSVIVRSQPPGGMLYIDEILKGTTPMQVDSLLYGRHTVLIEKQGYKKFRDVVSAGPGRVPEYTEYLVPEPQTGYLGVESSPEGAVVSRDGLVAGITPTRLERVSSGNHTVLIRKEGYENYTAQVSVPGDESVLVKADLVKIPETGTIVIDSVPQGAEIYLNGTFKALTPAVLEKIPRGGYILEFRKRTYPDLSVSFFLNPGETHEVFVNLSGSTAGSAGSQDMVYLERSNASQFPPGLIDTEPSIERTYTWYNNGREATIRLRIPQDLYDYYNGTAPHNRGPANVSRYVLSEQDRTYLHDLIGLLKDAGRSKSFTARNDLRNVIAFAQAIRYADDLDPATGGKTDYWQYPAETLVRGEGDCEDHAILAAALMKEMGHDVALVLLNDPAKAHAAVAVACDNCNGYYYLLEGKKYYFLETTAYGSALGTMDEYYKKVDADVIVL